MRGTSARCGSFERRQERDGRREREASSSRGRRRSARRELVCLGCLCAWLVLLSVAQNTTPNSPVLASIPSQTSKLSSRTHSSLAITHTATLSLSQERIVRRRRRRARPGRRERIRRRPSGRKRIVGRRLSWWCGKRVVRLRRLLHGHSGRRRGSKGILLLWWLCRERVVLHGRLLHRRHLLLWWRLRGRRCGREWIRRLRHGSAAIAASSKPAATSTKATAERITRGLRLRRRLHCLKAGLSSHLRLAAHLRLYWRRFRL